MGEAVRRAIFLSGSIGAGKSTLGAALARARHAAFIEGDAYSDPDKDWFASSLTTARRILAAICAAGRAEAIVAYPLRRVEWTFYRRRLEALAIQPIFIGLRAEAAAILDSARGRVFDRDEQLRIKEMIAQGYGARGFYDAIIDTDARDVAATAAELARRVEEIARSAA